MVTALRRGHAALAGGEPRRALEEFSRVDGDPPAILAGRALAHAAAGEVEAAIALSDRIRPLDADDPLGLLVRARVRIESGRPADAIALLDSLRRLEPGNRVAATYRAIAHVRSGDAASAARLVESREVGDSRPAIAELVLALEDFLRHRTPSPIPPNGRLELDANRLDALLRLVQRAFAKRDPATMRAAAELAVRSFPDEVEPRAYLGWALFCCDDHPSALDAFDRLQQLVDPAHPLRVEAMALRGHCHLRLGGLATAAKCLDEARELGASTELLAYPTLLLHCWSESDPAAARRTAIRRLVDLDRIDPDLLYDQLEILIRRSRRVPP